MHLTLALIWLLQADGPPPITTPRSLRGMYTLVDGKDEECVQVDEELATELAEKGQCVQAGRHSVRCQGTPHREMFRTRYQCEQEQKKRF